MGERRSCFHEIVRVTVFYNVYKVDIGLDNLAKPISINRRFLFNLPSSSYMYNGCLNKVYARKHNRGQK